MNGNYILFIFLKYVDIQNINNIYLKTYKNKINNIYFTSVSYI